MIDIVENKKIKNKHIAGAMFPLENVRISTVLNPD